MSRQLNKILKIQRNKKASCKAGNFTQPQKTHFFNTKIRKKMKKQTFTAIIFFADNSQPYKYRGLQNLDSFKKFVLAKYTNALYYNLYDKATKNYFGRVYLKDSQHASAAAWNEFLAR